MSAHAFMNLLNELSKRDKTQGYAEHFIAFGQVFNKSYNSRARMFDFLNHMTIRIFNNRFVFKLNVLIGVISLRYQNL